MKTSHTPLPDVQDELQWWKDEFARLEKHQAEIEAELAEVHQELDDLHGEEKWIISRFVSRLPV